MRFLMRDRDATFVAGFDTVFRSEDVAIIRTPFRAPNANAVAERGVRSAREECLDHLLIFGARHLHRVLREYVPSSISGAPIRASASSARCRSRSHPRPAPSIGWTCSAGLSTTTSAAQRCGRSFRTQRGRSAQVFCRVHGFVRNLCDGFYHLGSSMGDRRAPRLMRAWDELTALLLAS